MSSDARTFGGAKFYIETAVGSEAYTQIKECGSGGRSGGGTTMIDVTHSESTAEEKKPGFRNSGSIALGANFVPDDAGQIRLRAAMVAKERVLFKIEYNDTPGTEDVMYVYVTDDPVAGANNAKWDQNFTLEIDGDLTRTP